MPSLKLIDYKMSLNEIEQPNPIRFAFGCKEDDIYSNTIPFVRCRDYLSDVLFCYKNNVSLPRIYGFESNPQQIVDNILLIKNVKDIFLLNLKHLHEMEEKWGITKTEVVVLDNEDCLALHFDPIYLSNTVLLAYYTTYIRLITYVKVESDVVETASLYLKTLGGSNTDRNYLICYQQKDKFKNLNIKKLMVNCNNVLASNSDKSGNIHNTSGIYTYLHFPQYIKGELQ